MTDLTPHSSRSVILTVADVVDETDDARSIIFDVPAAMADKFTGYRPGQFLTLRIPSDRTGSVARCYSLASSPLSGELPKVTVKRTRDGYGSHWVCDNLTAGSQIEALPPSGVFTPTDLDAPLLLIAAGSGVTPVMSILKTALAAGSAPIVFFYANRSENDVIFATELRELTHAHDDRLTVIHWLESLSGLPSETTLARVFSPFVGHHAYLCGPGPFMDAVHKGLAAAGFPHHDVHSEVYSSLSGDPFTDIDIDAPTAEEEANAATVEVELDGETHTLRWPRERSLVDVMIAAGIDVPYSCLEGECGSCACTLTEGTVDMDNPGALDDDDIADGYILGCQSKPTADRLRVEF
ncbi:2Fe-2S iron-sulfur cluster binding domain-containing protein [Gordonia pseudamarae]|jgi:3-ketosteroid 9alpha-monooxygenase subunit B|uniref:2Fe-2S iron-sulfur cluster binding domain-containing protein n=1 Tax=Gordonia pseudamarae TaxID=2831662 RepID=A0ABX6IME7_9ACTN|nr:MULTISPECIES: ferredoxin--NADP reductase [Gordonia]MBD0021118.1 ferredoxin--NADP reductase [Gordonia sp. (in: high G+C Gram-positive bacteria)]QHN27490.1 2Fe-2S iron-sulfur cluster binding domain-containing protein [Gordonia pseudamarae]QHN36373.1 2Fe-2S iron-sulfur cluster binding domain-containing protein [Gordonia pseudamarae]